MPAAIIRAPSIGDHRVRLSHGSATADAAASAQAGQDGIELERALRAELQQEYERKFEALKVQAHEEGFAKGHEAGLSDGRADGHKAAMADWASRMERVEAILSQAEVAFRACETSTANAAQDLAFGAVCQLLGEHALKPDVVAGAIRQLTGRLSDDDVLKLRLHPAECEALREAIKGGDHALKLRLGRLMERLTPDASLDWGGCVIETPRGEYCGTLDVQLTRLRLALQGNRRAIGRADDVHGVVCA